MALYTRLLAWLKGELVGVDSYGNKYYRYFSRNKIEKRFVIYKGITDASKVPPEWHIWLHYTTSKIPVLVQLRSWQKEHMPNLTGTPKRYLPSEHDVQGDPRATRDYEAWHPE